MTALDDRITDLARLMPQAQALTTQPATTQTGPGGKPQSRPPWNPQPAYALWDALAAIDYVLDMFRYVVTGASGQPRPASATGAKLKTIANLSHAVPRDIVRAAEREFAHRGQAIMVLTDVDEAERPQLIPGIACPYCHVPMVMTLPRAGVVYCNRGLVCADENGFPPRGQVMVGRLGPCVEWNDGLVT